jgi:hypothetical protein
VRDDLGFVFALALVVSSAKRVFVCQSFTNDGSTFRRRKWVNRMGVNVEIILSSQSLATFKGI